MKINKKSWHYRLNNRVLSVGSDPYVMANDFCGYVGQTLNSLFPISFLGMILPLGIPGVVYFLITLVNLTGLLFIKVLDLSSLYTYKELILNAKKIDERFLPMVNTSEGGIVTGLGVGSWAFGAVILCLGYLALTKRFIPLIQRVNSN